MKVEKEIPGAQASLTDWNFADVTAFEWPVGKSGSDSDQVALTASTMLNACFVAELRRPARGEKVSYAALAFSAAWLIGVSIVAVGALTLR